MKRGLPLLAAGVVLVSLAQYAHAQAPRPRPVAPAYNLAPMVAPGTARVAVPLQPVPGYRVPPYSYYAARPPFAARNYWGYGRNDFPYYGQPYGRPYDLWTWPYMSSDPIVPLTRYYHPPLG